jgi:hypothetical protein
MKKDAKYFLKYFKKYFAFLNYLSMFALNKLLALNTVQTGRNQP